MRRLLTEPRFKRSRYGPFRVCRERVTNIVISSKVLNYAGSYDTT